MKLTSYSNYALRTLQMAALRHPRLTTVAMVARAHRLSNSHITKIVHELGQAGFLETVRGRGGGFRLARPAEEITVGEVVRLTEGPIEVVECFNPSTNTCPLLGACRLSGAINEATRAFFDVLDKVTIADIAHNRDALLARLALRLPEMAEEMTPGGHDDAGGRAQEARTSGGG